MGTSSVIDSRKVLYSKGKNDECYTHKNGDIFELWTSRHGTPYITRYNATGEALISFEFSSYEEREKAINQALARGNIHKIKGSMDKGKLLLNKKILNVLDSQIDGFICPNQTDFRDVDVHEFFRAIDSLIEDGILRKRNCDGLAYEMVPTLEARLKAAEICKSQVADEEKVSEKEFER